MENTRTSIIEMPPPRWYTRCLGSSGECSMSARSALVGFGFVLVLAPMIGCGSPPGESDDVDDEADEQAAAEVRSPYSWGDDMPGPHDVPMPVFEPKLPQFGHDIWDLRRYLEKLEQTRPIGNCYRYYVTLLDPGRGYVEVPITQCN
jgi:hypothetical protein